MGSRSLILIGFPGDFYGQEDLRKSGLGGLFRSLEFHKKREHKGHLHGKEVTDPLAGKMPVPAAAAKPSLDVSLHGKGMALSAIDISVSPGSGRVGL